MITELLCRLRGHKWRTAWDGGPRAKGAPFMFCLRCKKNGWLIHDR